MKRLLYFAPLASFPLMALAEKGGHNSMRSDNPYIAAAMIFLAALAVSVVLINRFRLQKRGRLVTGVLTGAIDWIITAPITMSAGVRPGISLIIASASAALLMAIVIRSGQNLSSFFNRNNIPASGYDSDND
ncbi:MAG: hypothetical protein A2176_03445 [Spirochaetes bacterium RBG_13_51_14]|nr:MAG: hypothetical protein A2176_03445 [Spirochaetes bacterium RBG_13_51_14]